MSDLHAADDSAGDPGTPEEPTAPLEPGNWLLDDFMQARALAQHVNITAQLDAFAAAHGVAMDDDADRSSVLPSNPITAEPNLGLTANDMMPFGLKLQLAGDMLASEPGSPPMPATHTAQDRSAQSDAAQAIVVGPSSVDPAPPTALGAPLETPVQPDPVQPAVPPARPDVGVSQSPSEPVPPGAQAGSNGLWTAAKNAAQSLATDFYNRSILKPIDDVRQLSRAITSDPLGTISSIADSFPGTKLDGKLAAAALTALPAVKAGSVQTLDALRRYLGSAGVDMQWHHIVEQSQISQFGPEAIHDIKNIVAIPREIHQSISGYYSSRPAFTDGLRVRDWLRGKSFAEQYEFGVQQLAKFLGYQSE